MQLFNTSFIIVSLIIFTMCVSNLSAQDNFADPEDLPDGYENSVIVSNSESSNVEEEFTMDNIPDVNSDPRVYTDEYGSQTVNRAVYFGNGSNSRKVSVPHSSDFNQTADGSVEMWVYPTDLTHTTTFMMKSNSTLTSNNSFYWAYSTGNYIFFRIGGTFFSSTVTLSTGTWTHIAVTWDVLGGMFTVKFYKNGVLGSTIGPSAATYNTNTDPLIIGGSNAWPSNFFEGYIDEVRFWGDDRTTTEIRDNRFVGLGDYSNANTGNALTWSTHYNNLISSWTFNTSSSTAYDDIRNNDGTLLGGASKSARLAGQPIPYNLALKCDGTGTNSYVKIPHNSTVFNQTSAGSIEAWIFPNTTGHQPIFSKGTSSATTTFAFGIAASNKLYLQVGTHAYIAGGFFTFTAGKWYHVAATWTGGSNRTVRLYVNGNLISTLTFNITMPTNTDDAWIGRYYSTTRLNGYIDEVRIWNPRLTDEQIRKNMLVSGKALLPNTQLVGCWNFDGNLRNWSATTGIDGSFFTGSGNDCRLSGYSNETNSGAFNTFYDAHTTVLNGENVGQAYFIGKTGLNIPNPGYIQDTIHVDWWNANVTNVRTLISIQHQYCGDIEIRLTAPNGVSRDISTDNGAFSDNGYLTIFYDGHSQPITGTTFWSPWTNAVKPEVVMGNFGGSPVVGDWILRVTDDFVSNSGTLMGWGLRFNNSSTNISTISSNIPGDYKLHQNYPNPFNPFTNINFEIPKAGLVSIKVYDITGREISTLVNQSMKAGSYNVDFDASNFASGTYFYKIQVGDFTDVKKMMLVK